MTEMTIKEAAEALEISVDTVRRRIKDNKINAWKVEGKYGPQWVIDSKSLADYQHVTEAVPVKYNMDPDKLIYLIKNTVKEGTYQGIEKSVSDITNSYKKDYNRLEKQVNKLQKQNEKLIELIENQKKQTLIDKFKGLFK